MSYDETLAGRVRGILAGRRGIAEKKMFGGLAFLSGGRMFCGVLKNDLVARVGPSSYPSALAKPHVRPMDFTGRPLQGYVYVGPAGCKTPAALRRWVLQCLKFAATLPRRS